MKIILYNNQSTNNVINKTLTQVQEIDITFKGVCDILKPTIKIKSDVLIKANYLYIEDFQRYYFIDNIQIEPKDIYILYCSIDVLKTYSLNIIDKKVNLFYSDVTLDDTESTILITTGV